LLNNRIFTHTTFQIMGKLVAVANQKGGVGKTTTTVNLAACLGALDKRVLLIDADPQANASSGLGVDVDNIELGTYQLLEHNCTAKEALQKTSATNVDIIPAHIDLVAIEIELVNMEQREYMLKQAIEPIKENYDFILIDCAPSLGLLTLNALTAADSVIIPIQCEYFALEGLGKLLNTIKSVQKIHNKYLDIEGLLLTMYDSRLRLSNQVVEEVQNHFSEMVFKTIIQRNVKLGEAPSYGESIIYYDVNSKGATNYLSLAKEIIRKQ
jgi:chromosome partitioning protein